MQSLNSAGKGEKYQVSISKRPSSMRSMFLTLVNSSCSRIALASKSPCSSPWSSSNLRFWLRLQNQAARQLVDLIQGSHCLGARQKACAGCSSCVCSALFPGI